jgi:undecaprenyl diphosphate synthase
LPARIRKKVDDAIARTRDNSNMTLVFALSYSGRCEIVDAARKLLRDAEIGKVDPESIDEKTFAAYLYDPEIPDPDL